MPHVEHDAPPRPQLAEFCDEAGMHRLPRQQPLLHVLKLHVAAPPPPVPAEPPPAPMGRHTPALQLNPSAHGTQGLPRLPQAAPDCCRALKHWPASQHPFGQLWPLQAAVPPPVAKPPPVAEPPPAAKPPPVADPPPAPPNAQTPRAQVWFAKQVLQVLPFKPHVVVKLPAWHLPSESQHPAHVAGPHFGVVGPHDAPVRAMAPSAMTATASRWGLRFDDMAISVKALTRYWAGGGSSIIEKRIRVVALSGPKT